MALSILALSDNIALGSLASSRSAGIPKRAATCLFPSPVNQRGAKRGLFVQRLGRWNKAWPLVVEQKSSKMATNGPVLRTKAQASTGLGVNDAPTSQKTLVQHTFGLPTAPGPHFRNTSPMYDVTFTSINFHSTIGHTINTLILLLPTLYFWNDPRWKFVLLAKLTLPEAVWEQASHYFTRQLHNVHKWKIVPLLVLDAIFFANGGAQQVLNGPKDGLYYFMLYYFVVFMGGNLIEAFITFFGQYWPIKAPGSI